MISKVLRTELRAPTFASINALCMKMRTGTSEAWLMIVRHTVEA